MRRVMEREWGAVLPGWRGEAGQHGALPRAYANSCGAPGLLHSALGSGGARNPPRTAEAGQRHALQKAARGQAAHRERLFRAPLSRQRRHRSGYMLLRAQHTGG